MKFHGYDNRDGINVKTWTKRTCTHILTKTYFCLLAVAQIVKLWFRQYTHRDVVERCIWQNSAANAKFDDMTLTGTRLGIAVGSTGPVGVA